MKQLLLVLFISLGLTNNPAFAGSGHEHGPGGSHKPHGGPVDEATVIKRATKVKNNLAIKGTIPKSWATKSHTGIEKKTYAKGPEWVVTFNNKEVKDKKKQTLYIFYSVDGHYIAANYTGN